MAAGEDQPELIIPYWSVISPLVHARAARCGCHGAKLLVECPATCRPAKIVDRTVACGRHDPPRRAGWDAVAPPSVAGHNERLLDRVLGQRDVAEEADQRRHRLAVRLAEDTLNTGRFDFGGGATGHALTRPVARNGRTSIGWLIASTTLRAQASAASRSSALMM